MKRISSKVISSMAVLSLITGCGKEENSKPETPAAPARQAEEVVPADGSNIDGHYQAKFLTLNPHVNGTIPGSANFFRKEDKIYAYVRLFAGGVKAWHPQHVYTGGRCPTPADDTNGDGFIDINEAEAVMGKILIPLDADISSQKSGRRFFPLADLSGYYHYERITSFRRFLNDLQDQDEDPQDDTVKLAPGEGLSIVGKTVLIQGVAETVELPETVGTKGRHQAFQTLPIACGVFEQVKVKPGTPYDENQIPGPLAPVEPGQDRPAGEDTPDTTGGSSGGHTTSTTGSNDSDDGDGPVSDGNGRTSGGTGTTTGSSTTTGGENSTGHTGGATTGGSTSGGNSGGSTTTGGTTTGNNGSTSGGEGSTSSTTGGSSSGSSSSSSTSTTSSSSSSTTTTTTTGGSTTGSETRTSTSSTTTTGGIFGF